MAKEMHSTIALLQERFRQLQRLKDMRIERDLSKLAGKGPESSSGRATVAEEPPKHAFQCHAVAAPSSPMLSLSLWPDSMCDESQYSRSEDSTSRKKRRVYSDSSSECFYTEDGLDTSLHL